MTHLPDVVNQDSWTVITDTAKAEYALVGFDENGRFAFTSRATTNVDSGTVTETVTADRALIELVTETSTDSVRNIVTTETTAGFLDFQNDVFVAQSVGQFDTYPGITTFQVDLVYGAIGTTTQSVQRIADASWSDTVLWGYVIVDFYNPTVEIDPAADVSVLFAMTGDRKGTITVRNNSPNYIRFATTGGQPALRVQGYLLTLSPTAVEYNARQGSVTTYGPRLLPLDASPYRQWLASMRPVAVRLLQQLAFPVPVIDQFTAVGNPTRRVGDTLNLVDPHGLGSIRAGITKLSRHLSSTQGLVDTLTVRPVGPPGTFILDDPVLGVLGDPTLYITP
jgi:hypothetical protein